ncbi:hypothetical protein OPQ81_009518 [Rhizoctonia solani]|nr:hypothetical protein OPQ81_009518 [Rhizoctonia solani]
MPKHFVSLGLFILDEFEFLDVTGKPTGKTLPTQVGGGGTYAVVGARIWLPASEIGQIVDRGADFPASVQHELKHYGSDMWYFRDQPENRTTRAVNRYTRELRDFDYLTPRIRLTPKDLPGTPLESPRQIHFICSPARATQIMNDADTYGAKDWKPFTIYEPIPFSCVPEELPALKGILHRIDILSPNAEEALGLLSIDKAGVHNPSVIEFAATQFLSFGIGKDTSGYVIIRCGAMGAYAAILEAGIAKGWWTPAYWTSEDKGSVVDVTGAGNAFLGGLSAGLHLSNGNVREAILYATISAGYTIQQLGLPHLEYKNPGAIEFWNGDRPQDRLALLRRRCADLEMPKHLVSLGLFILDEFEFLDLTGRSTGKAIPTQIGGGSYTAIGARIWLAASEIGQIVDRGDDFPTSIQQELLHYGSDMWYFRNQPGHKTTRAVNRYTGELRDFDYLTPRIRLTPRDLPGTPLESPRQIHFVCSPTRAAQIIHDADTYGVNGWEPFTIYEPIPISCIAEELPMLKDILHRINILSPNAEEALGLLSIDKAGVHNPSVIEFAATQFLSFGIGKDTSGYVIIRCGAMGAYAARLEAGIAKGWWTPAYWTSEDKEAVVDVTGAGNAFLGGLSAGLYLSNGDVREAVLYATISAGYTIQQLGLPRIEYRGPAELWNGDRPKERLELLRLRCADLE